VSSLTGTRLRRGVRHRGPRGAETQFDRSEHRALVERSDAGDRYIHRTGDLAASHRAYTDDRDRQPDNTAITCPGLRRGLGRIMSMTSRRSARRKNRENMAGRINGWKQILHALTAH
jgi:hypothetical protein